MILPCIQWSFLGWVHFFFPLLSFFVMSRHGERIGGRLLISAAILSFFVYFFTSSTDLFVFSGTLLFSGYVLFRAKIHSDSPVISGFAAFALLGGCWLTLLNVVTVAPDLTAYSHLLKSLDEGIKETLTHYRQSGDKGTETTIMVETMLLQMKAVAPMVMPAIIGSFALFITWFTMVIGNTILLRITGNAPWPNYKFWLLPDRLIWFLILLGILVLSPRQPLWILSLNCIIILAIIYCFQGLSIAVFFMDKLNVPLLLRSFIYVMIVFQSLGTLLLLIFGIADTWFDFRKLRIKAEPTSE